MYIVSNESNYIHPDVSRSHLVVFTQANVKPCFLMLLLHTCTQIQQPPYPKKGKHIYYYFPTILVFHPVRDTDSNLT